VIPVTKVQQTPVRAAAPRDAQGLAALHARAFDHPWLVTAIADLLAGEGVIGLMADDATGPLGFVLARVVAGEAEILTIAVDPNHRRSGLGQALLTAASDLAMQQGGKALFLEVSVDNQAALALYEKARFVRVGLRRGYYTGADGQTVDALVLRRNLNKSA
jgi:ribosomal-protein-alanine N-acetyltransferase